MPDALLPQGLAVPAVRVPGGFFAVRDPYDTAFGDVLLAVLTPTGSRPFARNFGSRLDRLLFTPLAAALDGTAEYVVRDAVARQCPTVRVVDVAVSRRSGDGEGVAIALTFSLANDPTNVQTRRAFLRKSDLLRIVYAPAVAG